MSVNLEGKVALVTGASRGIGYAVAKKYASLGADVIAVARTLGGLEELDDEVRAGGKGSITIVPFDLRKLDDIDSLALSVAEKFGRLDILVGNAGVLGSLRPISQVTNKIWQNVMKVNLESNFRLIRAFDGLIRKSESGRVIFVTSGVANKNKPFWGAYAISKAALEAMILTYAEENKNTNIRANIIDPGVVRTKMRAEAFPGEDASENPTPDDIIHAFVELASENCTINGEIIKAREFA